MTGQEFYDTSWHHPGMAWALCTVAVAFIALTVKDRSTKAVLLFLTASTELDAWLTGGLAPFDSSSMLARNIAIAFVIWGDARMFVLLEKWRGEGSWTRAWVRGIALSFVVPVLHAVTMTVFPQLVPTKRHIFLLYETEFVVLACVLLATRYARTWKATSVLGFFLVQYALWVLSDVLILSGAQWAYWLRLVPNALYYGLFLLFAARQETNALSRGERGGVKAAMLTMLFIACAHAPAGGDNTAKLEVGARTFTLGELKQLVPQETVRGFDPYYQREKTFLALPLEPVLKLAYPDTNLANEEFLLRASDGYTVPVNGARLLEGAYLAFADANGAWEPIGAKQVNPGPWYVVWKEKTDLTTHPRPWALAKISAEKFEVVFPRLVPPDANAQVQHGFQLFKEHCVKCHALNQEGGRVGPELNIPKNVTEYRDEKFLRAWIRNPGEFRISVMPPSPELSDDDLTALLRYLEAMKLAKSR